MIVLDASAWVDILTGIADPPDPASAVFVPPHLDAEVVGTLRALAQRGVLSDTVAENLVHLHLQAHFTVERDDSDVLQAWRWRESMSFAGAWYAALALRLGATLITTDQRAAAAADRLGVRCQPPTAGQ